MFLVSIKLFNDWFSLSLVPNCKPLSHRFILIFLFTTCWNYAISQSDVYLQIEEIGSTETIKIPVGSTIIFKASKFSDHWQRGKIKEIIYESNTIIFDHTFMTLDAIEKIKIKNFGGQAIGYTLQAFGVGWLTLGAIAEFTNVGDQNNLDARNLIVGATAIGTGILIQKVSGNKVYSHDKTHRFRLIDLRFSVEKE